MPPDPATTSASHLRRRSTQLGREITSAGGTTAALAAIAALGIRRGRGSTRASVVSAAAAGLLGWHVQDAIHRLERLTRSAEDAAVLSAQLGPASPMFGRWAAEGDFAGMIARELEQPRQLVVECGSGATTLVIASALRRLGSGRLVTFEHDASYAQQSTRLLESAGLGDVARVVEAPLQRQTFGSREAQWYDREIVESAIDGEIDVVVIDGPPQVTSWARWPAMQVLYPHLAPDFVALLDDGRTRETSRAVKAWEEDFEDVGLYWLDTVKGTWLVRRGETSEMRGPLLRVARILHPRPSGFGRWPVHR